MPPERHAVRSEAGRRASSSREGGGACARGSRPIRAYPSDRSVVRRNRHPRPPAERSATFPTWSCDPTPTTVPRTARPPVPPPLVRAAFRAASSRPRWRAPHCSRRSAAGASAAPIGRFSRMARTRRPGASPRRRPRSRADHAPRERRAAPIPTPTPPHQRISPLAGVRVAVRRIRVHASAFTRPRHPAADAARPRLRRRRHPAACRRASSSCGARGTRPR
ncbi:MAG: hypothetical protein RI967_1863 [Planctomycetota bacterium]